MGVQTTHGAALRATCLVAALNVTYTCIVIAVGSHQGVVIVPRDKLLGVGLNVVRNVVTRVAEAPPGLVLYGWVFPSPGANDGIVAYLVAIIMLAASSSAAVLLALQ